MRRTKIITTLGPATDSREVIGRMVSAGVDIFRLNMTHAKEEWVREVVPMIRDASAERERSVAVLVDLQGPSIRTGDLDQPLELHEGGTVELVTGNAVSEDKASIFVNYGGLVDDLDVGDLVLVDNGVIQLRVTSKPDGERLKCEVLTPGVIGSRRHINLPGVRVRLPGLTEADMSCASLAAEVGVDFVALSFVREAVHIDQLRELLGSEGSRAQVVAKIEDQEAMRNLDEIIVASDAVMVARGDLGIEVHVEELPLVQRRIVRNCIKLGKRVIVATHMLESMIENPLPTRAEVSDVANAVYEQADAVMLSGETSVGAHPVKCVEILNSIAARNELGGAGFASHADIKSHKQKTVKAAVGLADSIPGCVIVVFTKRGLMADYVANLRPESALVYAFTPDEQVIRYLCLSRGVTAFLSPMSGSPEAIVEGALDELKGRGLVDSGDSVVVLSDVLGEEFAQDSIHLKRIE
ncbi:MAG: pyruvate kinase [Verrucomicrobiaceae bacterium]|nr:pyruvate kinase [Verrucomicrobiaceae bacterium]